MLKSLKIIGVLAFATIVATDAGAQSTPLTRLQCTSQNFPSCGGWGPANENPYSRRTFIPGGGPTGQDAVELAQVPVSGQAQYYFGWFSPSLPNPGQGAVRYLRMRMLVVPPVSLAGNGDIWTDKFIILADATEGSRVICTLTDNGVSSDNLSIHCSKNISGPPDATPRTPIAAGRWNNLQIEFRSSSSSGSGDGRLKIWMNNNNFSSPTVQSGPMTLAAQNWGNINIGFYANATISSQGRVVFRLADVEFDDEFHPSWSSGTPSPPPTSAPAAPLNLRILSSSLGILSVLVLPVVIWRGRRRRD